MGLMRLVYMPFPVLWIESDYSVLPRLLADRDAELERANKMNQSLQEDWKRSAELKRQRDWEEKAFER